MQKILSIRHLFRHQSGQGLVETAIVAPILIFFLIGVFEVGYALRSYLVLTNVSRETTRFGVRPNYLNYTDRPPTSLTADQRRAWVGENVGYDNVISHMFDSMAEQLNTTTTLTPALVISHLVIDTKYPCDPAQMGSCNCNQFTGSNPAAGFVADDLILHPNVSGYEDFYTYTYDPDTTDAISYTTTFNYAQLTSQLAADNNKFNCDLLKRTPSATPSPNYVLITEMFYRQPQLFGFPLIANPFTDPVPMFTHTIMRMINSRTGNDLDKIGPACELYPMTFKDTMVQLSGGQPTVGQLLNIYEGSAGGNMGWISWNSNSSSGVVASPNHLTNSEGYFQAELTYPRLPIHDFVDAVDSGDTSLNPGDKVKGYTGPTSTSATNTLLQALVGRTLLIPVFSQQSGSSYTVSHFAEVQVSEICRSSSNGCTGGTNKSLKATFLGYEDEVCGIDGAGGGGGGGGGGNNPPVANSDSATTAFATAVTVNVIGNDTDPDGDTLSVTGVGSPVGGTVVNNGNGTATFTPTASGAASFTYTISDGHGGTATGTVNITVSAPVNQLPVANNDNIYGTNEDTALSVTAPGVLNNDTDGNGDPLTAIKVTNPAHGTVTLNSNGSFVYTPAANYSGSDSFTYKANDSTGDSNVATVTITVNPVNDPPLAVNDGTNAAPVLTVKRRSSGGTAQVINVRSNDSDPEGNTLTITAVTQPSNGTVTITGGGTTVTYNPPNNSTGNYNFTYTISDGLGGTATATVYVKVTT